MKFLVTFLLFTALSLNYAYNQGSIRSEVPKNCFLLDVTLHYNTSFVKNKVGNIKALKPIFLPGFVAGIGYQSQLNNEHGLEFFLGYGTLNIGNRFEMDEEEVDGLSSTFFEGNFLNDGFPFGYNSLKIEHLYRIRKKNKTLLSLKSGLDFKSILINFHNRHENGKVEANSFKGSITNINQGEPSIVYYDYSAYFTRFFHINPVFTLRYEYINSYNNMVGLNLKIAPPFLPMVNANIETFPDYPNVGGSFEQTYYGGFIGLSLSFSFNGSSQ